MPERTVLSEAEIQSLDAQYSVLPNSYLDYLRDIGWGQSLSGNMIYSGPIEPDEVYPHLADRNSRLIIGDDMQGYCLGIDLTSSRFGEFSNYGEWSELGDDFDLALHLAGDR